MDRRKDFPLTIAQIEFVLDYICLLVTRNILAENVVWLDIVERALENAKKNDPHARALARVMAKRGMVA